MGRVYAFLVCAAVVVVIARLGLLANGGFLPFSRIFILFAIVVFAIGRPRKS